MGKRKEFIGTVISDKMPKTTIVRIMQMKKHLKYGRIFKRYNKFKVHDEKNIAKIGDIVRIQETRPLSKDKRFRLIEVLKKAQMPHFEINPVRNTKALTGKNKISNGVNPVTNTKTSTDKNKISNGIKEEAR